MGQVSREALLAASALKLAKFNAKFAIHRPHAAGPHQYWHAQANWWRPGIKGSGGAWRFPKR